MATGRIQWEIWPVRAFGGSARDGSLCRARFRWENAGRSKRHGAAFCYGYGQSGCPRCRADLAEVAVANDIKQIVAPHDVTFCGGEGI